MVFLKISQNSQEDTCTRIFLLIKLQAEHLRQLLSKIKLAVLFQIFSGGTYDLEKPVTAQYTKISPFNFGVENVCLQVELYGCSSGW